MKEEQMLYCLVAFILGWLVSRHMGNGFSVGVWWVDDPPPGSTRLEACEFRYKDRADIYCAIERDEARITGEIE